MDEPPVEAPAAPKKRVMTEAQLENLAAARAKAAENRKARKQLAKPEPEPVKEETEEAVERPTTPPTPEPAKPSKAKVEYDSEDEAAALRDTMIEAEVQRRVAALKRRKKPAPKQKRITYVLEESSSEEEEVVLVKKKKKKAEEPPPPPPPPPAEEKDERDTFNPIQMNRWSPFTAGAQGRLRQARN